VCHKGLRYGTTAPEAEAFSAGFQALAVAKVRAFPWQSVTAGEDICTCVDPEAEPANRRGTTPVSGPGTAQAVDQDDRPGTHSTTW
jgi:hypothetical protein